MSVIEVMAEVGGEVETPEGAATRATANVRTAPRRYSPRRYLPRLCSKLREHLHMRLDNTDWVGHVAMGVRGGGEVTKVPPL